MGVGRGAGTPSGTRDSFQVSLVMTPAIRRAARPEAVLRLSVSSDL